ncbi:MAG: ABC transporter permease subunit [Anaerolineae bacterium]|nr:ABC transporter permease subunit [Anaerolineae bacterium]
MTVRTFGRPPRPRPGLGPADIVVLLGLVAIVYVAAQIASGAPAAVVGPEISLAPGVLPYYSALSVGRMLAAYGISLVLSLAYGYVAAHSPTAARGLLPLLDVLQSVPILSFLPVTLVSLSALLPDPLAVELASVILIVTSMIWNMAFSVYQSFSTVPRDILEASSAFRLSSWLRFRLIELPFATQPLVWNSILSWAGGWFFLMAAESFTLGERDFRLPGLGSYLQKAAETGDAAAAARGIVALALTIIILDQLIWRPALAWSERFRIGAAEPEEVAHSWLYDVLSRSWLVEQLVVRVWRPFLQRLDMAFGREPVAPRGARGRERRRWPAVVIGVLLALVLGYASLRALILLGALPLATWLAILSAAGVTLLRVIAALAIGALWAVPAGVLIGTNRRVAAAAQPIVQVVASIPATALFPIIVVALLGLPGGLNVAAIILMLLGTQWYILFNVIAGTAAIPRELEYTADVLRLGPRLRWTTLLLPALFPYLITGLITASGGAWNASIVAEYVVVAGETRQVPGIGALISLATANGDYTLLLAATLTLSVLVAAINQLVWRRLYARATERFRFE